MAPGAAIQGGDGIPFDPSDRGAQAENEPVVCRASAQMAERDRAWLDSAAGREMAAKRAGLPIAAVRGEVLSALEAGDVVIVCGDTGCGKTTQVREGGRC